MIFERVLRIWDWELKETLREGGSGKKAFIHEETLSTCEESSMWPEGRKTAGKEQEMKADIIGGWETGTEHWGLLWHVWKY